MNLGAKLSFRWRRLISLSGVAGREAFANLAIYSL